MAEKNCGTKDKDQSISHWYSSVMMKSVCSKYVTFKSLFSSEEYLTKLKTKSRIIFAKPRANNNRLPTTAGKYQNVPREERQCNKYDAQLLRDECRVVLLCNNQTISQLKHHDIPEFFWTRPNRETFCSLMQCNNIDISNKFLCFLDATFKMFR